MPRLISTSVIVVYCCAPCVYAHRKEGHCFTCEPLWQIPIFNNSSRRESHLVCPTNGQWLAVGIRHTVTYYITFCTFCVGGFPRCRSVVAGLGPLAHSMLSLICRRKLGIKPAQSVQPMQEAESPKANRARLVGTSQTSPDSCSVIPT